MSLLDALRRVLQRPIPRSWDLDVTDQWLVLSINRFGACDFRRLEGELYAIRGVAPAEVVTAVLKLEREGILERTPAGADGRDRPFRLTRAGRQLAHLIPSLPRSPTIFYR